ncbi:MAG: DegV family protein [Clostridiales bacterium]|nr:DegV family protein [Clostridiales bacterium]
MKKYIIITDSTSELDKATREELDIQYVPMHILYEDKDIPADLDWGTLSFKEFYQMMRDGVWFKTAQINEHEYIAAFEKYLEEGYDILSISCSTWFTPSYNSSLAARDALKAKYPESEIICIDSKNVGWGEGNLCVTASKLRAEGKTIQEVADYVEAHKHNYRQFATAESLMYLKRAGRVSATSAVFGSLLHIKPIIGLVGGGNEAIAKTMGRKNSLIKIVEMYTEVYEKDPYGRIVIVHGDCLDDANTLKAMLLEKLPGENIEIHDLGPIVGATSGPGTLAIYGYGAAGAEWAKQE